MKKQKKAVEQQVEGEEAVTKASDNSQRRRILRARAVILARENLLEDDKTKTIEFTEFMMANERYGMENCFISEVYPLKEYTALPGTPDYVFGIINVRGKILSVIDLRKFFDLPDKGLSDYKKVIIIQDNTMEFGILADVIMGVRQYPLDELMVTLPTLTDVRSDYLKGVTKDRMVVLDGGKLLGDRKIIVHEAY